MPATTPNRLYPYPVPSDPVDVPGDIQRLAESICADLQTVESMIRPRPIVQLRSSQPQLIGISTTTSVNYSALRFDTVDIDTGGFSNVTTQPTLINLIAGRVYWVWATVRFGFFFNGGLNDTGVSFQITSLSTGPTVADKELFHTLGPMPSTVHSIGAMYLPSAGTETIQAVVAHDSAAEAPAFSEASFGAVEIRPTV